MDYTINSAPKQLLIYRIEIKENLLILEVPGSHSDLLSKYAKPT